MAIHVAIVEDDDTASRTLSDYLLRYAGENHIQFRISAFHDAVSMLDNYTADVESSGHRLTFHTFSGEYTQYSSLTRLEEQLAEFDFARCNSCYLVNLRYVREIKGYTVFLDNCELKISQPRKKSFVQALEYYFAEHPGSIT